jgi:UDP-2,3-diacylglucosamine hydrolase
VSRTAGKLGLIAGGGSLPLALAERCRAASRPLFVLRLKGFADPAMQAFEGGEVGIAELGHAFDLLKRAGCESVCFAGVVTRPDFAALKPDFRGVLAVPGAIAASRRGDDALLRFLLGEFEKEGFRVEGAHEVDATLTLGPGPLGAVAPASEHVEDIDRALDAARAIGALDIGQAAVAVGGVVLALEAQEGTDAMLERCAGLPAALRGAPSARRGVLAKAPKPIQEWRMDMPAMGVETVERAAAAGLAGIVGEAGALLIVDRAGVIAAADRLGLFVYGVEPGPQ